MLLFKVRMHVLPTRRFTYKCQKILIPEHIAKFTRPRATSLHSWFGPDIVSGLMTPICSARLLRLKGTRSCMLIE
jgi:hypothetical protein